MIIFKNELPLDHKKSLEYIVSSWTVDMFEYDLEMGMVKPNMDYCQEVSWNSIEEHLSSEGLEMEYVL